MVSMQSDRQPVEHSVTSTATRGPCIKGSFRFRDARLHELMLAKGAAVAWRAAFLELGAIAAAGGADGDFAVGMHDERAGTFLAVDRFAVRTMCYRLVGDRLHFAERADTLAAIAPAAPLCQQALFDYLYFHAIPSPRTAFEGVNRLPAGHCAIHTNGELKVAAYWTPEFAEDTRLTLQDAGEEFRGLLRDAVRRRLNGERGACYLSGGTDSSTIAGMIGEAGGQPARSFSIGFDAEGYDEMAYARMAANRFNTEHHEYYVTPTDVVESLGHIATAYDQPFGNSSALPAYYCARMAAQHGVRHILAGDGGDELFGGNVRYAKQRVFGLYSHLPDLVRRGFLEPALLRSALGQLPLVRKAASYVQQASQPMPDRLDLYNLLTRIGVRDVLTPEFLQSVDTEAPMRHQRQVWNMPREAGELNRMLAFDWRYTLAESDLPKVSGTAQLAGIEVGFPMLDDALVRFSARLPRHFKLNGLKLRWFFKEALRGFLPEEILSKKKHGFGLPFGVWAVRHPPLARLAADAVQGLVKRRIVQEAFVRRLFGELLPAHPGYYGEMVWILAVLEHWLQHWEQRPRSAPAHHQDNCAH